METTIEGRTIAWTKVSNTEMSDVSITFKDGSVTKIHSILVEDAGPRIVGHEGPYDITTINKLVEANNS